MPKDKTKNIERYKIQGGHLNEFEYHENQQALAEETQNDNLNWIPGTPPEQRGEGLQPMVAKPATKSTKNTKSKSVPTENVEARPAKHGRTRGATAKKLAARKAEKKLAAGRATKKIATRKASTSKASTTKKSSSKSKASKSVASKTKKAGRKATKK